MSEKKNGSNMYNDFFGGSSTSNTTLSTGGSSRVGSAKSTAKKPTYEDMKAATSKVSESLMGGVDAFLKTSDDLLKQIEKQGRELREQSKRDGLITDEELAKMEASIQKDFGNIGNEVKSSASQAEKKELVKDLELVNELEELLTKELVGQKEFIKSYLIAFKRPNVMGVEKGSINNAILLCGNPGFGKHSIVNRATSYLGFKNYLHSNEFHTVDLSEYTDKEQETIFLQDMYMASKSKCDVLLFDHVDMSSTYFLQSLVEVVKTSELALNKRYGINKGQLVEANNALLTSAVKSISFEGKYLVFLSEKPLNKLTDTFGTTFTSLFMDICENVPFTKEELVEIATRNLKEVTYKTQEKLNYTLSYDDSAVNYLTTLATASTGVIPVVNMCERIYAALAQYKLEEGLKEGTFNLSYTNELTFTVNDQSFALESMFRKVGSKELANIKDELDNIVGLSEVKDYLLTLENDYQVQAMRKAQGLKTTTVSKHMIFTGNPGTGKTTIARILARYLKSIGVLSGGQLVEVTRADLVGRYVGHTAPLTNQVIKSALGGVLFIDEAYSLYRGKDDSFGLECIDTLVKGMEDNRDNLVVVLAGYSKEMQEFLTSNSGLKSRFPNIIEFPNYTGQELLDIAKIQAKSKDYTIAEDALEPLLNYFNEMQALNAKTSGNGRLSRNTVEAAILNQSKRLVAEPEADMQTLELRDFDLEIKAE